MAPPAPTVSGGRDRARAVKRSAQPAPEVAAPGGSRSGAGCGLLPVFGRQAQTGGAPAARVPQVPARGAPGRMAARTPTAGRGARSLRRPGIARGTCGGEFRQVARSSNPATPRGENPAAPRPADRRRGGTLSGPRSVTGCAARGATGPTPAQPCFRPTATSAPSPPHGRGAGPPASPPSADAVAAWPGAPAGGAFAGQRSVPRQSRHAVAHPGVRRALDAIENLDPGRWLRRPAIAALRVASRVAEDASPWRALPRETEAWRDLPESFGPWASVCRQFRR